MEKDAPGFPPDIEYRFKCQRCSSCCRGEPGYVFLTAADLSALARFFGKSEPSFIASHCRVVDVGRRLFSLREKAGYDCILWDGGCTAYAARPVQCRTYPFWDRVVSSAESWRTEARYCPGIGKGEPFPREEIERRLRERSEADLLGPGGSGVRG